MDCEFRTAPGYVVRANAKGQLDPEVVRTLNEIGVERLRTLVEAAKANSRCVRVPAPEPRWYSDGLMIHPTPLPARKLANGEPRPIINEGRDRAGGHWWSDGLFIHHGKPPRR